MVTIPLLAPITDPTIGRIPRTIWRVGLMFPAEGSVSRWLGPLQESDPAAAQLLWERYFHRLVELARTKLRCAPPRGRRRRGAERGFDSFCRGAGDGRFPDLADRDGLWRLLVVITARKAAHHSRDARRQKRGGGTNAEPPGG